MIHPLHAPPDTSSSNAPVLGTRWAEALPLSLPHTEENIDGFTVHIVRTDAASADTAENAALIACFDEDISEKVLSDIAQKKPLRAVFRDSGFASDQSKINVLEIFKCHAPDTQVKVI